MAEKTTVWNGTTNTDWETAGNWSNGQPAYIASPGPYDTVYVNPDAANPMALNLDRSGDGGGAGLHLELFETPWDYEDDIGGTGAELKLTAEKVVHRGRGTLYMVAKTGTDGEMVDRLIIDSEAGAVLSSTGASYFKVSEFLAGVITNTLSGAGDSYAYVAGSDLWGTVPDITYTGTVTLGVLAIKAGTVDYGSSGICGTLILGSGVFVYNSPGADLNTVYQGGGIFYFDSAGASINTGYRHMGGVLDATRTLGTKTIADYVRWPTAVLLANDDFVTFSASEVLGEN